MNKALDNVSNKVSNSAFDIDLLSCDLTAQIAAVNSGDISASELNQQQLALIEKLNPSINAFITVNADLADDAVLASPKSASPNTNLINPNFAGLTIAAKDNIDINGMLTTAGMATRRQHKAKEDAFVIAKLKAAKASFSGKLNMHEAALGASNHNPHYGNCYNPHRLTHSPGGSSGGSAAAVAAAMAPLSLGTDTMGSVRIPAAYCGVFGFKPSNGMVSNRGSVSCQPLLDTIGPIARSARDLRLAMNVMAEFDHQDPHAFNYRSMGASSTIDTKAPVFDCQQQTLMVPENLQSLGVEDDIIIDFENNLSVFTDMGFKIKRFNMVGHDFGAARRAGLLLCEANMRIEHQWHWQHHRDLFSNSLQKMLSYIDRISAVELMQAFHQLDKAKCLLKKGLSQGEILLMPTAPQRAFHFDEKVPANQADLSAIANMAGAPAVNIPMLTKNSLPAGMQLVADVGQDELLLTIAERWQAHSGFSYQLPATVAELLREEA